MSLMPPEQPRYEEMQQAVELFIQNVPPGKIAKQLGIGRAEVLAHVEEWKKSAAGSEVMRERVEALIPAMDQHYSMLIGHAYDIVKTVDEALDGGEDDDRPVVNLAQLLNQKRSALDLIAKLEKDRLDALQKAGVLNGDALGAELMQMEEEKAVILDILGNDLCPRCKPHVMGKIGAMLSKEAGGNVVVVTG